MKEPKNLMRAEITFILQIKLKNMPIKSNYQKLSKLKMFRIKCSNNKLHSICSPVHCILFTVSYIVCIQLVTVWFTNGSPFVI